ncbi:MAG TPA: hypothetical protein VGO36_02635 [Solirubrobacterales bacterium]|jgi:chromosome segregation ATPase|nr:hypothetical protein [Solirubrobacterales bacterium]
MDDSRGNSTWLWVLGAIALAVAVVGLVIAISANNSSVDEDKIVNEAKAELKGEITGVNGALQAGREAQQLVNRSAARDRRQIKRIVNQAITGGAGSLGKLEGRVAALQKQTNELQAENAKLQRNVAGLDKGQATIEAELTAAEQRLRQLSRNGGTAG